MALTSTLYTGLSGLNVNQQKLNVIGNNIANVNTVAFKSSRTLFKPQFYVTDAAGSPPSADFGGTNPSQRGLGATVASIQKNFNNGSIEATGVATDLAIDGTGFFVIGSGVDQKYTRDGSFLLNENKELVSGAGEFVKGYAVDDDFQIQKGAISNLTIPIGSLTIAEATSAVSFKGNLNADGAVSSGASILETQALLDDTGATPTNATALLDLRVATDTATPMFTDGQMLTLQGKRGGNTLPAKTLTIDATTTLADLNAFFQSGMAINTSADVLAAAPAGYVPGVGLAAATATGDPAGSLRLQITGNSGSANALTITGAALSTDSGANPFVFNDADTSDPVGESQHTAMTVYDSLGTPLNLDVVMTLESSDTSAGTVWRYYATSADDTSAPADGGIVVGSGTVEFDANGVFRTSSNTSVALDRESTGAVSPLNVTLDFGELKSLTTQASSMTMDSQDGFATGELRDYAIGDDGTITGFFSNGLKRPLGQVAIATFDNPQGLIDMGGNNYRVGASSGQPIIDVPGQFSSGLIRGGSLEQSNVDLSKEFIDMIVTSTGFNAASKVITTSDELLNQLLQISR
jgi:flagellar hook protein FlgE